MSSSTEKPFPLLAFPQAFEPDPEGLPAPEIRVLSAVDVKALRKRADDLAKELRALDNRIQAANWTTEVEI